VRETRVLQVALDQPGTADGDDPLRDNRENFLAALEAAGRFDPDFVCFPELTLVSNVRDDVPATELAHPIPGEITDEIGERARALDSYVWVPTYERDGEDVYNAMALIGPDGDCRGSYRKVAPTNGEIRRKGVTPGSDLPTWDTEFGRVAATICWDVRFDELGLRLGAREVDLMFHPTLGMGRGKLASWATYFGYHVAYCFPSDMRVYAPTGNEFGRSTNHPTCPNADLEGGGRARFAPATVNTDVDSFSQSALGHELDEAQRAYPDALEVTSRREEGVVVVESVAEDVPLSRIVEEFDLPRNQAHEDHSRDVIREHAADSPIVAPDEVWRS
jgi:hypothetical protein